MHRTVAAIAVVLNSATAFAEPSPADRALDMQINLSLSRAPLSAALQDIAMRSGLNVVIDWPALRDARIAGDVPVTISLNSVSARTALHAVLQSARRPDAALAYIVHDEIVRITTEAALAREIETRVYRCADLLPATLTDPQRAELESAVTKLWRSHFSVFAPSWRFPRAKVGPREEAGVIAEELRSRLTAHRMEQIAGAVHNVAPNSTWCETGGPGSVTIVGDTLVVTQSVDHHLRIESLLGQLRHRLSPTKSAR